MVSSKIIDELKECFRTMEQQSLDLQSYTGTLHDVVVDITTADTFIAGITSKLIDGERLDKKERAILSKPLLLEGRWWQLDNGTAFDVERHPDIYEVANTLETVRDKCNKALVLIDRPKRGTGGADEL